MGHCPQPGHDHFLQHPYQLNNDFEFKPTGVILCRWVSGYRRRGEGSVVLRNVGTPSPHDTSVTSQKTLILSNLKSGQHSPIALHNTALTQIAQLNGSYDGQPTPCCPNCRAVKRRTDQSLARGRPRKIIKLDGTAILAH